MEPEVAAPMPVRLVEAAARLLAEEGPAALSARRVAAEVGASTMVVYTHFGGMAELVRGVALEGFARLRAHLAAVATSDDPVADIARKGMAYRQNALENPFLYAVMFGSAPLGGYRPSGEDLAVGRDTFEVLVEAVRRAMDAGRFRRDDPGVAASQLWSALHGFVTLELAGFFGGGVAQMWAPEHVLLPLFVNQAVGLGDQPEAVARSIASLTGAAQAPAEESNRA